MSRHSHSPATDAKDAVAAQLRASLARAKTLRSEAADNPSLAAARNRLREWQAQRLAHTHADLLADPLYAPTARYFLSDLYGPKDFSALDDEIEKLIPIMLRVLPLGGLSTVALAVEMDALSEAFDAAMARALGLGARAPAINEQRYAEAYRRVGDPAGRARQIMLVREIGEVLGRLTKKPLLTTALKLMRKPAAAAGLSTLYEFLARGFEAFSHMGDARPFLERITTREEEIRQRIFAGKTEPFKFT